MLRNLLTFCFHSICEVSMIFSLDRTRYNRETIRRRLRCDERHKEPETDCIVTRGRHLSYQRGKRNTNPGTSLIKIEGVDDTKAAKYVKKTHMRLISVLTSLLAFTLERRLLSCTVHNERLEDQK